MTDKENISHQDEKSQSSVSLNVNESSSTTANEENAILDDKDGNANKENDETVNDETVKVESEDRMPPQEKLQKAIARMEAALTKTGNPDFKAFWGARKDCLNLFQEDILPAVKALHWEKYRELTKEAKRLKGIFEEQTAFAVEQIEKAIQGIEEDIGDFEKAVAKVPYLDFPDGLIPLQEHITFYREKQRTLSLLNAHAARINALRKELIRTEMRIRKKNAFFQRLSVAGDLVFPQRKALIQEISRQFLEDVKGFVSFRFRERTKGTSLHLTREEIKALQAAAKALTLNTEAFSQTRIMLSECWDRLKALEKERKRETALQREAQQEIANDIKKKVECYSAAIEAQELSVAEAQQQYRELNRRTRSKDLNREEAKSLQIALNQAYKPIKEKLVDEEKARRKEEFEKETLRQTRIKEIEERATALHVDIEKRGISELFEEIQVIHNELDLLELSDFEKASLISLLDPVQDAIVEKEEAELLALTDHDPEKLSKLENMLQRAQAKKMEIEGQKEKFRNACSGSGLDFEQSMYFSEQLGIEKKRLEKVNHMIATLESTIARLRESP